MLSQFITSETGGVSDEILFCVVFLFLVLHGVHINITTFGLEGVTVLSGVFHQHIQHSWNQAECV